MLGGSAGQAHTAAPALTYCPGALQHSLFVHRQVQRPRSLIPCPPAPARGAGSCAARANVAPRRVAGPWARGRRRSCRRRGQPGACAWAQRRGGVQGSAAHRAPGPFDLCVLAQAHQRHGHACCRGGHARPCNDAPCSLVGGRASLGFGGSRCAQPRRQVPLPGHVPFAALGASGWAIACGVLRPCTGTLARLRGRCGCLARVSVGPVPHPKRHAQARTQPQHHGSLGRGALRRRRRRGPQHKPPWGRAASGVRVVAAAAAAALPLPRAACVRQPAWPRHQQHCRRGTHAGPLVHAPRHAHMHLVCGAERRQRGGRGRLCLGQPRKPPQPPEPLPREQQHRGGPAPPPGRSSHLPRWRAWRGGRGAGALQLRRGCLGLGAGGARHPSPPPGRRDAAAAVEDGLQNGGQGVQAVAVARERVKRVGAGQGVRAGRWAAVAAWQHVVQVCATSWVEAQPCPWPSPPRPAQEPHTVPRAVPPPHLSPASQADLGHLASPWDVHLRWVHLLEEVRLIALA